MTPQRIASQPPADATISKVNTPDKPQSEATITTPPAPNLSNKNQDQPATHKSPETKNEKRTDGDLGIITEGPSRVPMVTEKWIDPENGWAEGNIKYANTSSPTPNAIIMFENSRTKEKYQAVSNLEGYFKQQLPVGRYIATVSQDDYIAVSRPCQIKKQHGCYLNFDLSFQGTEQIQGYMDGYVHDTETGRPIQGVTIKAIHLGTKEVYTAASGPDGHFMSSLPFGEYKLTAERDGYITVSNSCHARRTESCYAEFHLNKTPPKPN